MAVEINHIGPDETEVVARAIVRGIGLDPDAEVDGEPQWRMYVPDARAAIVALDNHRSKWRSPPAPPVIAAPACIADRTFAVQHNPNCPSPWLVRLHGKGALIDMKPYLGIGVSRETLTKDALGFGKTFEEAATAAIAAKARIEGRE